MKHQLPNGKVLDLPDDASNAEIQSIIDQESPPEKSFLEKAKEFLTSTTEGGLSDSLLKSLPAVGATAGATLAAPLIATGPWGVASPVGGAALGGAAGASVEDFIRNLTGVGKQPTTPGLNPLKAGAEMGAWETGAGSLLNILSRIGAPVAKALETNPLNQKFADFALKNDLPMSPSTINPSWMAKATEAMTNMFPTGKMITSKYQNELYRKFLDTRAKMLGEITETGELMGTAPLQDAAVRSTKEALRDASKEAYSGIIPAIGGRQTSIPVEKTRELIDNILESSRVQRNPEMVKLLDSFNTKSRNGSVTAQDFYSFQGQINATAGKNRDYSLAEDIWSSLNQDIKAYDHATGTQLMDVINTSKGAWIKESEFKFMSDIFKKSSTITRGEEIFQPDKFYSVVMNDNNQKYIKKQFGDDVLANLRDYAEFARKIATESNKKNMSDMQKLWQQTGMALGVGGAGTSLFTGPGVAGAAAIAVPMGSSYIAAHMLMKPRGVFKKWLTTGFEGSEAASQALKIGGRAAISPGAEN
jgi:hypothetical protein